MGSKGSTVQINQNNSSTGSGLSESRTADNVNISVWAFSEVHVKFIISLLSAQGLFLSVFRLIYGYNQNSQKQREKKDCLNIVFTEIIRLTLTDKNHDTPGLHRSQHNGSAVSLPPRVGTAEHHVVFADVLCSSTCRTAQCALEGQREAFFQHLATYEQNKAKMINGADTSGPSHC